MVGGGRPSVEKADERMERWGFFFFSFSLSRSPLASVDDAISHLHSDRCQEAAGTLRGRGIKEAAPHLPVHLCACVCVGKVCKCLTTKM